MASCRDDEEVDDDDVVPRGANAGAAGNGGAGADTDRHPAGGDGALAGDVVPLRRAGEAAPSRMMSPGVIVNTNDCDKMLSGSRPAMAAGTSPSGSQSEP